MIRLKFAGEYVDAIDAGEKNQTVRVDLERTPPSNSRISLLTEEGEVFGEARLTLVGTLSAAQAYDWRDRPYRNLGRFLDVLRRHYPDAEILPSTDVTVLEWESYSRRESYWREIELEETRRRRGGDSDA